MHIEVENSHDYALELHARRNDQSVALHHESVSADLGDLVEETYVRGVMSGQLPAEPDALRCRVEPGWSTAPVVKQVDITLEADSDERRWSYSLPFQSGRWMRRSVKTTLALRDEGSLDDNETPYTVLLATRNGDQPSLAVPRLVPPVVEDGTLDDLGVRSLGEGSLVPDRPVLVNERMEEEIIACAMRAGPSEAGGGVLGKTLRLPEPLPGTQTRIVTVLTACIADQRHVGVPGELHLSVEALAECDQVAQFRGLGERVETLFHTHGWGTECGNCNQNADCLLPEASVVSVKDYQVMESMFPSKATLMPIAGRKLGSSGQRPVLLIHGWRGGTMRQLRWQRYAD